MLHLTTPSHCISSHTHTEATPTHPQATPTSDHPPTLHLKPGPHRGHAHTPHKPRPPTTSTPISTAVQHCGTAHTLPTSHAHTEATPPHCTPSHAHTEASPTYPQATPTDHLLSNEHHRAVFWPRPHTHKPRPHTHKPRPPPGTSPLSISAVATPTCPKPRPQRSDHTHQPQATLAQRRPRPHATSVQ